MIRSVTRPQQLLFILLMAICCHIQLIANAQNITEIKGQVNDESGQPITSASVFAKNQSTGQTAATQTDSLGIFTYHSGLDLVRSDIRIVDDGFQYKKKEIAVTTRIGVDYAGPDALLPYRFIVRDNPYVSGKRR